MPLRPFGRNTRAIATSQVNLLSFVLLLIAGTTQNAFAQNQPLTIFKNYFVTGDYVVAGWNEGAPDGTRARRKPREKLTTDGRIAM